LVKQVQVLESEVADLEKELALRSEMEAVQRPPLQEFLKSTLLAASPSITYILWLSVCLAACCLLMQQQVQVLESEVADLEKELALRSEMEAALKDTLRELERKAARQDTGGRQVR
jgi:hypothetical protein